MFVILGGSKTREQAALAHAARWSLPTWVSGPALSDSELRECAIQNDMDPELLVVDFSALDTIGNFTSTLPSILRAGIKEVTVLTSASHVSRSCAIARIVSWRYSLCYSVIAIENDLNCESLLKVVIDAMRAMLWCITGFDPLALFVRLRHPDRVRKLEGLASIRPICGKLSRFAEKG